MNAMPRPEDFRCWWTTDSYLWSFAVYRKIDGEWIWSAGMVHANPVNNIIE